MSFYYLCLRHYTLSDARINIQMITNTCVLAQNIRIVPCTSCPVSVSQCEQQLVGVELTRYVRMIERSFAEEAVRSSEIIACLYHPLNGHDSS